MCGNASPNTIKFYCSGRIFPEVVPDIVVVDAQVTGAPGNRPANKLRAIKIKGLKVLVRIGLGSLAGFSIQANPDVTAAGLLSPLTYERKPVTSDGRRLFSRVQPQSCPSPQIDGGAEPLKAASKKKKKCFRTGYFRSDAIAMESYRCVTFLGRLDLSLFWVSTLARVQRPLFVRK